MMSVDVGLKKLPTENNQNATWNFDFRAIETNEPLHWNGEWLDRVLVMMRERGFNALVTHQNNLLDELTHLVDGDFEGVGDLRRKIVYSRVAWMRKLVRKLADQGAKLFLEVKEPSYDDYLTDIYPEMLDDRGIPNPLHPIWKTIVERKVREVTKAIPELGGLVVSLSSPESRLSPEEYERENQGQTFGFGLWLEDMIEAIRSPLVEADMRLMVRDFTYSRERQDQTVKVLNQPREGFAASIKVSPQDYFPGFPNNQAAARLDKVPVIFEFEAFGENMGWGVVPNCRASELVGRMDFMAAHNGQGTLLRINWEGVRSWSAIDCISDINIFALSHLSRKDTTRDPLEIISEWLKSRYDLKASSTCLPVLAGLLNQSFDCVRGIYWLGGVFPRHSQIATSWQQAWWSMKDNNLADWFPGGEHDNDHDLTDENQKRLFDEKREAIALADRLSSEAQEILLHPDITDQMRSEIALSFSSLPTFIRAFDLATRGTFLAQRYVTQKRANDKDAALKVASDMDELCDQFNGLVTNYVGHPAEHVAAVMFDTCHLKSFSASLKEL